MSIEALSALKQLVQVRQENTTIQNDNLEKVQQSVEQTAVTEAQRFDKLNLEKAKAQYEVALLDAKVKHLQATEERQKKAVVFQSIGLAVTGAFALGDTITNLAKDLKGGQQLGDFNKDDSIDKSIKNGELLVREKNGGGGATFYIAGDTGDNKNARQENLLDSNGKFDIKKGKELGLIVDNGDDSFSVTKTGKDLGITTDGNGSIDNDKTVENLKKGNNTSVNVQSVVELKTNETGQITSARAGTVVLGKGDKNFQDVFGKNQDQAASLFNDNARDIKKSEVGAVKDTFGKLIKEQNGKIDSEIGATSDVAKKNALEGQKNENQVTSKSLDGYFKETGKIEKGNKLQSVIGGVVSFANVVVPQFQALLKAKDDLENTEIELKAALEKLAAANRKLKAIEAIIVNAGSGGDGTALGNGNGAGNPG